MGANGEKTDISVQYSRPIYAEKLIYYLLNGFMLQVLVKTACHGLARHLMNATIKSYRRLEY